MFKNVQKCAIIFNTVQNVQYDIGSDSLSLPIKPVTDWYSLSHIGIIHLNNHLSWNTCRISVQSHISEKDL